MSFLRFALVLVSLFGASCSTCARTPVNETLKDEGEPCTADTECESALCDKLPGKAKVCFRRCASGCKSSDICSALAPNDRFACLPEVAGLCQPCTLNVDCPYPGDRCVEVAGTAVCTRDCSFDGQCPLSYRCADATDVNGAFVTKQCQPISGTCECTAASAGQTKLCAETNNFGTCKGLQTCHPPNGYDACSAPVPTAESCNGRDDDCNGMTDENLGETTCGTGECRRTVTNCVNGAPQACEPGTGRTEICDDKDNDCNALIDDGFDKQSSVMHCGACNTPCVRAHATPACNAGACRIGFCDPGFVNADNFDANGCEYACTATGPELCDGRDNDCDGLTDEDFSLTTDPLNCGLCNQACEVNNGHVMNYVCVASSCGVGLCSLGYANCDGVYATGCERDVRTDINNCGNCNVVCAVANGVPGCVASTCTVASCNTGFGNCNGSAADGCEVNTTNTVAHCGGCNQPCPTPDHATASCVNSACGFSCAPGYVNLDGLAANGCEYQCTATGADVPDLSFTDVNCDGIDGDAARAIFVATTGYDGNPGTRDAPKRTINTAIGAAAAQSPKYAVYVSAGVYNETVVMEPGVSVFGGYDASSGWTRSAANTSTIASSNAVGVLASGITLSVELQLFTVSSANASGTEANGDGRSSIGIHIVGSSGGVTVRGCTVSAGSGSVGANGADGVVGAVGGPGGPGGQGSVLAAGAGGSSPCGAPGGAGGLGVDGEFDGNGGTAGTQAPAGGLGGNPGSGGTRGNCSFVGSATNGGDAAPVTAGGSPGDRGMNGMPGLALGSIGAGVYLPASGLPGSSGRAGGGAGGGGSGGGTAGGTSSGLCTNCSSIQSGGGGGGGGGGCGGTSGIPGRGGGGSFAILISNSLATVANTDMTSRTGGGGGSGGIGGPGGSGGGGGPGSVGQTRSNVCSTRTGGTGASGAQGGAGGRGGSASGGAGGPSICLAYSGSPPSVASLNCTNGSGGTGGVGGNDGVQPAPNGPPGYVTQTQSL